MKKIIPVIIVVVVLMGGYVMGVLFFSNNFLPQTTINNVPSGGKDIGYVKQKIDKISGDKIVITGRDGVAAEIALADIEYTESFDMEKLATIKTEQNGLLWPVKLVGEKNYVLIPSVEYSKEKLARILDNMDIVTGASIVEPKDAYIKFDNGKYELVPEVMGNKINIEALKKAVTEALANGINQIDLNETNCYVYPKVYSDSGEIKSVMEKLDRIYSLSLVYDFDDRKVMVSYDTIAPWLVYEDGQLEINENEVRKFIEGLAREYDTLRTDRQFQTTRSGVITMGGGNYGWQTDIATSTAQLIEAINVGESKTIQPAYTTYGFSRKTDDIGKTYVEIDLTTQHMWYYIDGVLFVETDIVSGKPDGERDTPTGIFKLLSRETDRFLTGEDYRLHVNYWLPITWSGVGIHDSYWQTTYGGDHYLVYGSHGCLNTPEKVVAQIYENIKIGTPVLVYKSPVKDPEEAVEGEEVANAEVSSEGGEAAPADAQVETTPESGVEFENPVENYEEPGVKFEYPVG